MPKDKSKNAASEAPKKDKPKKGEAAAGSGEIMAPGSGGGDMFTPKDLIGELLLITPLSLEEDVVTSNGTSDAIRADIVVLNKKKPEKSRAIDGGLVFQKVLQGQLREALAKRGRVAGTLISDTASQKKGQSAPYRLTAPSDEEVGIAKAYLDSLDPLR